MSCVGPGEGLGLCHRLSVLTSLAYTQESPASVLEYVRGSSLRSGLQKLKQYRIPNDRRVRAAIALQAARGKVPPSMHSPFFPFPACPK